MPCGKSTTPEAEVNGLQEGKKYKFRVKAVNKEGESEPLENDELILAKNPYGKPRRTDKRLTFHGFHISKVPNEKRSQSN